MKVTVCFGETRFVVPCPPGTTVLKLEQEAILRYKRKNPDSWVVVHHLQSQSGILDPEDNISDVADDREELIASFEDAGAGPDPGVQQGGGDGASGSSVGTGSPDIFQVAPGSSGASVPPDSGAVAVGAGAVVVATGGVGVGGGIPGLTPVTASQHTDHPATGGTGSSTDTTTVGGGGTAGAAVTTGGSSCIEVTANEPVPLGGLGLQVRRGSEPSLHQIGVTDQRSPLYNVNPNGHHQETTKRWSAAPVCRSDDAGGGGGSTAGTPAAGGNLSVAAYLMSPEWNVPEEDASSSSPPPPSSSAQAFNRSGRLSMQFLGVDATASGYRWMEAAEKAANNHHHQHHHHQTSNYQQQPYHHHQHSHSAIYQSAHSNGGGGSANNSFSTKSLPRESTRKEPLGQAKPIYDSIREKESEMLLVVNESGGPLGLTAIPDAEHGGLLVQSVESGSRAERGRVRRGDRILEINGIKLVGLSEVSVQEHLRKSLASTELRLWVIRGSKQQQQQHNAAGKSNGNDGSVAALGRLVTGGSGSRYQRRTTDTGSSSSHRGSQMIEAEELPAPAKVATVSPTRKMPGGPSTVAASLLQVANTRKLGKRIEITLTKGDHGLGFSVTTRDNPAGGHCPIYIKNILPKGAAVEDGRLKPGDRLLEVEGIPMTGKSQAEVVSILRGTPHGATLTLVVSRQQELAADSKEREIGFGVEHEPKNSPPKPPAPVMPKPSLKQQQQSPSKTGKTGSSSDSNSYGTITGPSYSSVAKHTSNGGGTPKTPTVHKKPLASILKSASTNQMTELFQQQQQQQQQQQDSLLLNGGSGNLGGGASSSIASSGSLAGSAWKNREILTLHIPVHDTEKAGLGVSVKGKTGSASGGGSSNSSSASTTNNNNTGSHGNRSSDGDLGIFVKSVLHGGAASRDGRLKMNDQLLSVNGVSLLGQSNAEAMDTLRRAMLQSGGSYPGKIILTVARRIGRPISTGELLESVDTRTSTSNGSDQQHQQHSGNGGTTVIYLSPEKQPSSNQNDRNVVQQANRYSNPVLDRLTGGTGSTGGGGGGSSIRGSVHQHYPAHISTSNSSSSAQGSTGGGDGGFNDSPNQQRNHHAQLNQRGGSMEYSVASPPLAGNGGSSLRNDSYYLATHDQWNLPSSGLNGNTSTGAVLIEEDPEPTTPTFPPGVGRLTVVDGGSGGGAGGVDGNTSTPHGTRGSADPTYASQLSLETLPSPLDAFSRDAIGRRSMSEKHHAAMDARETGTYQRNKKLREEREREGKLMQLTGGSGASGGSMESIHQIARMSSLKQQHGGGTLKLGATSEASVSAGSHHQQHHQQQQSALYAEALDKLGDLGPSLGMKKSSSLESLQTMVQEIQMADEPRGPVALRTPRGRGREEILRAVVERPPEMKAKKHWLLEDATEETIAGGNGGSEHPSGGFAVTRNTPCQSSLNDGKGGGTKLRPKKSGGLLRGIGHMFRFGKHRKDVVLPSSCGTGTMMAADYTSNSGTITKSSLTANATGQSIAEAWPSEQQQQQQQQQQLQQGHGQSAATATPTSANSGSYVVYEPGSVERSASSGLIFQHQPPHYQPPPPPPTSNRYSHYVNYDELQQQISRGIQLYSGTVSRSFTYVGQSSIYDVAEGRSPASRSEGRVASCHANCQHSHRHVYERIAHDVGTFTAISSNDSSSSCQTINGDNTVIWEQKLQPGNANYTAELHPLQQLEQLRDQQRQQLQQHLQQLQQHEQAQLELRRKLMLSRQQQRNARANAENRRPETGTLPRDVNGNESHRLPGNRGHSAIRRKRSMTTTSNRSRSSMQPRVIEMRSRAEATTFEGQDLGGVTVKEVEAGGQGQMHWPVHQQHEQVVLAQTSRRHHHYHSQRSARNTPPIAELGQTQHQSQSLHHHHTNAVAAAGLLGQNLHHAQQKYKSVRPVSSYYDSGVGGGYETISHTGPPNATGGGNTSSTSSNSNTINNNNESGSSTNHHRKVGSSASTGSLQPSGKQQSEPNLNNNNNSNSSYHHQNMDSWHPGPAVVGGGNGTGGGTGAGGSMRNHRGPFVTQVQIQNQFQ
ncbi:partitioning defective 3 homolog isoform X2 [Anopheles albimanus]|uniref:partitioning defective 3 homolog isoform X2 n=1 Tax=Anopheles albimanus TaxID=7167 RepID=UPI00163F6D10|nr:partitioning defective 3 homolog isoform X2 [Anopheles albimanus]XP_035782761.1 partitioning defective 3 homolog isoform X2 [Anopheles albimanus]XP_035782771.1 partitioning defective 3 homolog isoform X2 [Anopheles albimanus]XP_035782782.1 partitioning defective 3 homolog isoform X2 [Anopheles albimanus]